MAVKAVKELHLGPPSRECKIMEAALGGDGGAMDHVVDEVFFAGSISKAILRAQGNDLVLIVFVAGENEESVSMELTTFRDPAVLDEVKKQSLIFRLQKGSTDAAYFAAIFILSCPAFPTFSQIVSVSAVEIGSPFHDKSFISGVSGVGL